MQEVILSRKGILYLVFSVVLIALIATLYLIAFPAKKVTRSGELINLRTADSQTFKNSDGTYTAEIYQKPIFYKDANGKYKKIDTRIINNKVTKAPYQAEFTTYPGYTFAKGNKWVSFKALNSGTGQRVVKGNTITYKEAYPSTDIKLTALSGKVKEEIILKSSKAPTTFSYQLKSNARIPLVKNNSLDFGSFKVTPPNALDAKNAPGRVAISLQGPTLLLAVDKAFLEKAKYPIVVDPTTVVLQPGSGGVDAEVIKAASMANTNYGNNYAIRVCTADYDPFFLWTRRGFIRFDISAIPAQSNITSGILSLKRDVSSGGSYTGSGTVYVKEVIQSWDEQTITWNNQPPTGVEIARLNLPKVEDGTSRFYDWDITNAVKGWYQNPASNYGMALFAENAPSSIFRFFSSDNSFDMPKLTVTYAIVDTTPPTVEITSPKYADKVSGSVQIVGTAADPYLSEYKIEYGAGKNPTSWAQIGSTHNTPVVNGVLEAWDTSTVPDNLYVIKLTAVDTDGNTNSTSVLINKGLSPNQEIILQPGAEGKDAYVMLETSDNYGNSPRLEVYSPSSYPYNDSITFIQFDLSSVPASFPSKSAYLYLHSIPYDRSGSHVLIEGHNLINLSSLGSSWEEDTINGNNLPAGGSFYGSGYPDGAWTYWNVTDLAKSWLNGSISNYGVRLEMQGLAFNLRPRYYSSDYQDNPSYQPKLVLNTSEDPFEPHSDILSPKNNSYLKGTSFTISGRAYDEGENDQNSVSGVTKVEVSTDGGASWQLASGTNNWIFNWSPPGEGTYSIKSTAYDFVGNIETPSGITVTIDNTLPQAQIIEPTNSSTVNKEVVIKGTANDANFSYYTLEYGQEVAPSSWTRIGLLHRSAVVNGELERVKPDTNGTYSARLTVVDKAGNQSISQINFNYTGAPNINPHANYTENTDLCSYCHVLHTAPMPRLLYRNIAYKVIAEFCYTCHDGTGSKYNIKADFDTSDSHHPIKDAYYQADSTHNLNCTDCHNPHGTKKPDGTYYAKLLNARTNSALVNEGNAFCGACHGQSSSGLGYQLGGDHLTSYASSAHNNLSNPPSGTKIKCANCHKPHGSTDYRLSKDTEEKLCYQCHGDTVANNVRGWNIYQQFQKKSRHAVTGITGEGNEAEVECSSCHGPHAVQASTSAALTDPSNTKNVWGGSLSSFCIKCHSSNPPAKIANSTTLIPYTIQFPGYVQNQPKSFKQATDSDFNRGTYSQTQLKGSGEAASVRLMPTQVSDFIALDDPWPLAGGKDTYVDTGDPISKGSSSQIIVSYDYDSGIGKYGLLQFNLSLIPAGSVVDSATLSLYGSGEPGLYRVTSSWGEETVTVPSYDSNAYVASSSGGWVSWDIADLTQKWLTGTYANYGTLLSAESQGGSFTYYSSDYSDDVSRRPKLSVFYHGAGYYISSGVYESGVLDASYAANFGQFHISKYEPSGTQVKLQFASSNNASGLFNFLGPDGTSSTYYTSGRSLWNGLSNKRYLKYKVYFSTTNTAYSPELLDIVVEYTLNATQPSEWSFFTGWDKSGYLASGHYSRAGYQCSKCHQPHGSDNSRLLALDYNTSTGYEGQKICLACHKSGGPAGAADVQSVLALQGVAHPILGDNSYNKHKDTETPTDLKNTRHSNCNDCHNPHQAEPIRREFGYPRVRDDNLANGGLKGVAGVDIDGRSVYPARYEYEVCFKCHDDIRKEFATSNVSYHPVVAVGKNRPILSFKSPWTDERLMACTDCHNNNQDAQPKGPHASDNTDLLISPYRTRLEGSELLLADWNPQDQWNDSLCLECHSFNAGRFPGHTGIVSPFSSMTHGNRCGLCHSPHSSSQPHLMKERMIYSHRYQGGSCKLLCHSDAGVPGTYTYTSMY